MALDAQAPINYNTNFTAQPVTPLGSYESSVNAGQTQAANQIQVQQAQLQQQQLQGFGQAMQQLQQNPTPANIAKIMTQYPMFADKLKPGFDATTQTDSQAKLTQAIPIYAAAQNGDTPTVVKLLNQQADAYDNAGRPQDAQQARVMAQLAQNHPDQFKTYAGIHLAGVMGPEKFATTFATVGDQSRAADLHPAAVATAGANATIAGAKAAVAPTVEAAGAQGAVADAATKTAEAAMTPETLRLKNAITQQEMDLKKQELQLKYGPLQLPGAIAGVNDAVKTAVTSDQAAQKFSNLADQFDVIKPIPGVAGTTIGYLKTVLGSQDAVSQLKNEYSQLQTSGVIGSLKGVGKITDREMNAATKGWPADNANPAYIATFLRGVAKLNMLNSATSNAQAEWLQQNGTLGLARNDLTVQGIQIPKGSTFVQFQRQFMPTLVNKIQSDFNAASVAKSPYAAYLQPPAPAPVAQPAPQQ